MKTTILLRQVTIGDDVRALIEKKIGKLDKFFLENAEAFVTLSKKREKEILELTISADGVLFRSEVDGSTPRSTSSSVRSGKIKQDLKKDFAKARFSTAAP